MSDTAIPANGVEGTKLFKLRCSLQSRFGAMYSQAAVARRIGVSRWSLHRWETGKGRPKSIDQAMLLANDYGVGVSALFGPEGDTP
jgi:DNA-binding XRE family transcriptional regulator